MTVAPSQPSPRFSVNAEEQLALALSSYLTTSNDEQRQRVGEALARICTEAHALGLGPEKMLIAVKKAWEALPARENHVDRKRALFDTILGYCLDAYYKRDS